MTMHSSQLSDLRVSEMRGHNTTPDICANTTLTLEVGDDCNTSAAEASCLGNVLLVGLDKDGVLRLLSHADESVVGITL